MNLRGYLRECAQLGELEHIEGATVEREIGALTELNAKRRSPRVLLFDHIPGFPADWGVVAGVMSTPRSMGAALGVTASSTSELLHVLRGSTIRQWFDAASTYAHRDVALDDTELCRAECRPAGLNVASFPAPRWHPQDGGAYIGTGCLVLTKDPDTGAVNAGAYRVMVLDHERVTVWMATSRHGKAHMEAWWARGERCPMVVVPGGPPLLAMLAGAAVPGSVSELDVAGAVRGEPLDCVTGELTGIPIPADAEFALEGFVEQGSTALEGPFGEGTGYYALESHPVPVIKVEGVYSRPDPLTLGAAVGKPPFDFEYPFAVIQSALVRDAVEASGVTNVQGVWIYYTRQMVVVSVKQEHPGHSRQAAYVAAHCGPGAYMARYVVAVDEDVDPADLEDVMWAVTTRADPATDIEVVRRGWGSPIDPMARIIPEGHAYNSRAVIDACVPYTEREGFPRVAASDPDELREIARRWDFEL